MMRSLFSGVAGLKAHQTRMDVIGNNIANINTTGFKQGRVNFQDTLNQTMAAATGSSGTLGGTNQKQVGLGVGIASIDTVFTDGNVQATSANTDLCISQAGFFIVSDGTNKSYTRNGAFQFDADGNYGVTGSGLKVQGWMADSTGKVNSAGATQDIVVKMGQSMPATATTYLTYGKNLSAISDNPTITLSDGKKVTYDLLDTTKNYAKGGTYNGSMVTGVTGASYTLSNGTTVADTSGGLSANSFPTTVVPLTIASGSAGSYTLSDGSTVTGATSGLAVGSTYPDTVTTVSSTHNTLSNGAILTPVSGTTHAIGDTLPSPLTITTMTGTGAYTLSDGSTVTGATTGLAVGSTYPDGVGVTVTATTNTLANGAIVTPAAGITYVNGNSLTAKIKTVASRTYTLSDGASVTDTTTPTTLRAINSVYPLTITDVAKTDVSSTISAYDSQGVAHKIPVTMTKTSDNTWIVKSTGTTDTGYVVNGLNYKIVFDSAGKYSTGSTYDTVTNSYKIGINPASFTTTQAGTVSMAMNFSDLTQNSGSTQAQVIDQNGNAAGSLTSVLIDTEGNLIGSYDNSKTKKEGQIALGVFNNAAGLNKSGSSLYTESANSGQVQVTTAGHGGAGKITPSALEMSNVDLSEEFSNMIVTQRGFQSNSKIITVADEMIDTLINMKR